MRGSRGVLRRGKRGKRFFCSLRDEWVNADDGVLCGMLVVRKLDSAIFVQCRLETVDGLRPREVLDVAIGFGHVPGHHDAIRELLDVAVARHPWFEKHTNRGNGIDKIPRRLAQRIEASNRDASLVPRRRAGATKTGRIVRLAKANRARNTECERIPGLPGKRKRKVMQRDARFGDFLAEVGIPLKGQVFDAVSFVYGCKAK